MLLLQSLCCKNKTKQTTRTTTTTTNNRHSFWDQFCDMVLCFAVQFLVNCKACGSPLSFCLSTLSLGCKQLIAYQTEPGRVLSHRHLTLRCRSVFVRNWQKSWVALFSGRVVETGRLWVEIMLENSAINREKVADMPKNGLKWENIDIKVSDQALVVWLISASDTTVDLRTPS